MEREELAQFADYADIDMDASFNYEASIISSDGNAASRDHSPNPGDCATDGVEEESFFPHNSTSN